MAVSVRAQLDPAIAAWLLRSRAPHRASPGADPAGARRRGTLARVARPTSRGSGRWSPRRTPPSTRTTSGPGVHWRLGSLAELDADPSDPAIAAFVEPAFSRVADWLEAPGRLARTKPVRGRTTDLRVAGGARGVGGDAARARGRPARGERRSSDCSAGNGPTAAGTATSGPRRATPRSTSRGARCGRSPSSETRILRSELGRDARAARTVRPSSSSRTGSTGATRPGELAHPEHRRHALAAVLALRPARRAPDAARRGSPR